jgi:plasmid stabilization system protein ParE
MVQKIKWTKRALADLYGIYEFIAKDSRRYAQIQIEDIQNAVLKLNQFPMMGHHLPEFTHLPYLEILVGNYRVLYRFDKEKKQVLIMSIVHGRRLLKGPLE